MTAIIAILCALISGTAFYFSTGLAGTVSITPGLLWALALVAPIPVLWFAFKPNKGWIVFLTGLAAGALGGCNLLPAYLGTFPFPALLLSILGPALLFAVAAMGAGFVTRRASPALGIVSFAVLWTAFDYLASFGPNGAALSPAYSQVGLPWMIQSASLFGLWAVTFVVAFFAAGAAMYAATRKAQFAIVAALVLAVNIGYGAWRIPSAPDQPVVRVGLAADHALIFTGLKSDQASALAAAKAYGNVALKLARQNASLIVFPEKIAVIEPSWHGAVRAEFETAAHIGHATVIAGFDQRRPQRRNIARIYFPNGTTPQTYVKRRLVPRLEASFVPGHASFMLADGTATAICKDMDFPAMLRRNAILHPNLYAVPAWDFGKDADWHARLAIMRGVEDGFAVARSANDGLLSLSDAYGRVIAVKRSNQGGMVTLRGDVRRGPGQTLYTRIGDAFAWICIAMSLLLVGVAASAKRH